MTWCDPQEIHLNKEPVWGSRARVIRLVVDQKGAFQVSRIWTLVLCARNSQNPGPAGHRQVPGKYTAAQVHAFYRSLNIIIVKQPKEKARSWNQKRHKRG